MNQLVNSIRSLMKEDDGAQVIEYALIIAVVSIFLVIALRGLAAGGFFSTFIARVGNCLNGTTISSCT